MVSMESMVSMVSVVSVVSMVRTVSAWYVGGVTSLRWTKAPVLGIRRSAGCSVPASAALRGGSPSRLPSSVASCSLRS